MAMFVGDGVCGEGPLPGTLSPRAACKGSSPGASPQQASLPEGLGLLERWMQAWPAPAGEACRGSSPYSHCTLSAPLLGLSLWAGGTQVLPPVRGVPGAFFQAWGVGCHGLGSACSV